MTIREARAGDEADWRKLWKGYLDFYGADVGEDVTNATWHRILYAPSPIRCRVATDDNDRAIGFAVIVLHEGSWVTRPIAYLEDLFVDPGHRGKGIGKALIDDLIALAKEKQWSRVYWNTAADNETARNLYDKYGEADGFVRYRLAIG
jgi:GNAT superfamily N-acetyltransferase